MGERVGITVKKPEMNRDNSDSRMRRTYHPRSVNPSVDRILFLQRTAGNQAVGRLIRSGALQAKLRIGQPGDVYEQEADRVADAVMRMPEPGVQRQVEPEEEEEETLQSKPLAKQITPLVQGQRQEEPEEEEEMLQAKPLAEEITPLVQRHVEPEEEEEEEPIQTKRESNSDISIQLQPEEEEEEELLQTRKMSGENADITPDLESKIQAIRGGGLPLSESERANFEPRFGHDFSQVRVHTDAQATETARALNANAFTVGRDVVFGVGKYAPETLQGKRLLGHELTYVVQQNGNSRTSHILAGSFLDRYYTAIQRNESDKSSYRKRIIANKAYNLYLRDISYFNPDPRFINTVRKKWLRILNRYSVGYMKDTAFITIDDMQYDAQSDFKLWLKIVIEETWKKGDNPKLLAKRMNELDDELKAAKRLVKKMTSPVSFTGKSWIKDFHKIRHDNVNSFMEAGSWTYVYSWFGEEKVYLDL